MKTRAHAGWLVSLGLFLGMAIAPQAMAQLPNPMEESAIKAGGERQLAGPDIRRQVLGNTSYVVFLADTGPVKKGAMVVMFARDERTRVDLLPTKEKQQKKLVDRGQQLLLREQGRECRTRLLLDVGARRDDLCLHSAGGEVLAFLPHRAGQSGGTLTHIARASL